MDDKRLRLVLTLRIFCETEKCFGPGMAELLERVDDMQSLRQATMSMEMAYSKAWRVIKTAERGLGFPLLDSTTGGKGGGGARLTPQARRFLVAYRAFERAVREYADEAFLEMMGGA